MAFEAALGWNGDAFAAYEQDGEVCVQAAFVGDTDEDEEEMAAALDAWAAAMVGDEAEVTEVDGHPGIKACDPGESIDLELTGRSRDVAVPPEPLGLPRGRRRRRARCRARAAATRAPSSSGSTYEQITDPEGAAFDGDAFQQTLNDALRGVRRVDRRSR